MLVLVLVLVLAAGAAGLMVFKRVRSSSEASPPASTLRSLAPSPSKPKVARRAPLTPQKPAPKPRPVTAAPSDQLPAAIRSALAANLVVVVALYDPKAKIDGVAIREARAGAELAGSSFVPIDVRRNGVDSLNARYGAIQDPAVLVLRPPGSLVVRIDGFADRDTVAQAAVNAAS
jgi:hypothetical protein